MDMIDISALLAVVGALTVVTNLVVEVIKKTVKVPANILAVGVALVLTLAAFFAWSEIKSIPVVWYGVAAAVVAGFMVAYASMFGYDKLRQTIEKIGSGK